MECSGNNLLRYLELAVELHVLVAEGRNDTPEADAIRDQMEAPWQAMSQEEVKRTDAIMSRLNDIERRRDEGIQLLKDAGVQAAVKLGVSVCICLTSSCRWPTAISGHKWVGSKAEYRDSCHKFDPSAAKAGDNMAKVKAFIEKTVKDISRDNGGSTTGRIMLILNDNYDLRVYCEHKAPEEKKGVHEDKQV